MKARNIVIPLIYCFSTIQGVVAQNAIFSGGPADGFDKKMTLSGANPIFSGGIADGYHQGYVISGNNSIYSGGIADGFASTVIKNTINNSIFRGEAYDGYTSHYGTTLLYNNTIFNGSISDGWSAALFKTDFNNGIFTGGVQDGFASIFTISGHNYIFKGGMADGHSSLYNFSPVNNYIFGGGREDGYAGKKFHGDVSWTGNLNTEWENPANWGEGIVPGPYSRVIIPSGRPNYPIIRFNTSIKSLELFPLTSVLVNTGISFSILGTQ